PIVSADELTAATKHKSPKHYQKPIGMDLLGPPLQESNPAHKTPSMPSYTVRISHFALTGCTVPDTRYQMHH
ncbi:TPA: hypothetical protein ACF24F_002197, partial [Klebsiella pneumoniae]